MYQSLKLFLVRTGITKLLQKYCVGIYLVVLVIGMWKNIVKIILRTTDESQEIFCVVCNMAPTFMLFLIKIYLLALK